MVREELCSSTDTVDTALAPSANNGRISFVFRLQVARFQKSEALADLVDRDAMQTL